MIRGGALGTTRPAQITLSTCKLSLTPLPSGPLIEFTDFETDIAWLSGTIYARLVTVQNPSFAYHTLDRLDWKETQGSLAVSGRLGPVEVQLVHRLKENPIRLEQSIAVTNAGADPVGLALLRIGPSWTPPESWWAYWGYWRLGAFNPDNLGKFPARNTTSLSNLRERLKQVPPDPVAHVTAVTDTGDGGWVFCDEKRFLVLCKQLLSHESPCPLDVVFPDRPAPMLVMGGIRFSEPRAPHHPVLDPGAGLQGHATMFIPGRGGWDEAAQSYRVYSGNLG